jgi:hypothetical protein
MEELRYLWKFAWYMRRGGEVEGLFVATESEIAEAIGSYVYFGEILGKHSEVCGTIEEGEITKIDLDPESVKEVSKYLGEDWAGYNPLNYIACNNCKERAEYTGGFENFVDGVCMYCREENEDGEKNG